MKKIIEKSIYDYEDEYNGYYNVYSNVIRGSLAYEGKFVHGVKVGLFKWYLRGNKEHSELIYYIP